MIDPKSLEIVYKIYLQGIRRDKIKEEYNLDRRGLARIERSVIKEMLTSIKEASEATSEDQKPL